MPIHSSERRNSVLCLYRLFSDTSTQSRLSWQWNLYIIVQLCVQFIFFYISILVCQSETCLCLWKQFLNLRLTENNLRVSCQHSWHLLPLGWGGGEGRLSCFAWIIRKRSTDLVSSHHGWESLRHTKECTITASKGRGGQGVGRIFNTKLFLIFAVFIPSAFFHLSLWWPTTPTGLQLETQLQSQDARLLLMGVITL